jgi:hypothetical protein
MPLYEKMKDAPYDVDLPALWKELGVTRDGELCVFSNSAPLAATLRAMTYGTSSPAAKKRNESSRNVPVFAGRSARKTADPQDKSSR